MLQGKLGFVIDCYNKGFCNAFTEGVHLICFECYGLLNGQLTIIAEW
jgi:hypothetical protein